MRSYRRGFTAIMSIVIVLGLCANHAIDLLRDHNFDIWGWLWLADYLLVGFAISAELWRGRNA